MDRRLEKVSRYGAVTAWALLDLILVLISYVLLRFILFVVYN